MQELHILSKMDFVRIETCDGIRDYWQSLEELTESDVWLTVHRNSVWIKNQLDVTFCILYFSSNSCSTCFGQPCAHHQELKTA
jgi:hypothetical protein